MHLDTLGAAKLPTTFISGENALLWDTGGRTTWDFYGGHAVTLIGLGDPRWREAIDRQARSLSFFTTLADVPVRTRAAAALCAFTGMDVAWFVNSGSEANEAALKIARKATGRPVIVAMVNGFHGRTMGSVGVTWKHRDDHQPPHGEVRFVPFGDLQALAEALDERVAAVITEPVQGMAGVVVPPAGWLAGVRDLAHANGSLLICDEIQCGMGRMGVPLASHRDGVTPDLVTVGKGLGGGFPVAALLMSAAMAASTKPGEHGSTFGGNPLACAAVEATLQIMAADKLLEKGLALGEALHDMLAGLPGVVEVRGEGAWAGVVFDRPARPIAAALLERGFLVGTSADPHVLRLSPPATLPICAVSMLASELADILQPELRKHA